MKSEYTVVKRLLRTEKGTDLTERQNRYFFEVDIHANKIEIKRAVERIYQVKVQQVNTAIMPRKPKIVRRDAGYTSERKKAIVQLKENQKIDLTT